MNKNPKTNRIFIVLGMHKSGTTLISKLLNDSSISMGNFDYHKDYDKGNHYERIETQSINKTLLNCHNKSSLSANRAIRLNDISHEHILRGKNLARSISCKHQSWGFKDPRTCLTYDFWKAVLPEHRIIVVYRHPAEVVNHYARWSKIRAIPIINYKSIKSLTCWYQYNKEIINIIDNVKPENVIIFNYKDLMENKFELIRLEKFIHQKIKDSRDPDKYRAKDTSSFLFTLSMKYNKLFYKIDPFILYKKLENYKNRYI